MRNRPRFAAIDVQAGGGKCSVAQTLVHTNRGILRMDELWERGFGEPDSDGFKPLKIGVIDHKNEYAVTDKVYRTKGKTLRVTFSDGTEFEALAHHPIWVYADDQFQFMQLRELMVGDAAPKAIPTEMYGKFKTIDGKSVDEDFATLLGLLVASGNFDNQLSFHSTSRKVLSVFEKVWENVFGDSKNLSYTVGEGNAVIAVECGKSKFAPQVKELCGEGKSADWLVPEVVRTSPKPVQCAFLRALFEGNGSIYFGKECLEIELCSLSKRLIFEVKVMLENMGILTSVREKNAWLLYIDTRSNSVETFARNIRFIGGKKSKRLARALERLDCDAKKNKDYTVFGQNNAFPAGNVCESLKTLIYREIGNHKNIYTDAPSKAGFNLDIKSINDGGICSRFAVDCINNFVKSGPFAIVEIFAA